MDVISPVPEQTARWTACRPIWPGSRHDNRSEHAGAAAPECEERKDIFV